jgi:hypothetical protein
MVGRFPTAVLSSWSKVARYYVDAREGLGFPAFRAEVLSQAKLWWTSVSGFVGFLGLFVVLVRN